MAIIAFVLAFRGFRALADAVAEVVHLLDEVGNGETGNAGVLLPPLAVRVVAKRTGSGVRCSPVGHDSPASREIGWKPICRPEAVANLLPGKAERRARKLLERGVRRSRGCRRRTRSCRWRSRRDRIGPCGRGACGAKMSCRNKSGHDEADEGNRSAHRVLQTNVQLPVVETIARRDAGPTDISKSPTRLIGGRLTRDRRLQVRGPAHVGALFECVPHRQQRWLRTMPVQPRTARRAAPCTAPIGTVRCG